MLYAIYAPIHEMVGLADTATHQPTPVAPSLRLLSRPTVATRWWPQVGNASRQPRTQQLQEQRTFSKNLTLQHRNRPRQLRTQENLSTWHCSRIAQHFQRLPRTLKQDGSLAARPRETADCQPRDGTCKQWCQGQPAENVPQEMSLTPFLDTFLDK